MVDPRGPVPYDRRVPRPISRRVRSLLLLALGLAACAGCTGTVVDPQTLELVERVPWSPEPPPPPQRLALSLACRLSEATAEPVVLRLPLPGDDPQQEVQCLSWQVGCGSYALEEDAAGERILVLHCAEGGRELLWLQAEVRRPPAEATPLPPVLAALADELRARTPDPGTPAPVAFVAEARRRGLRARVAHGLRRAPEGATEPWSWPEVLLAERWQPVDLAAGELALGGEVIRLGLEPVVAQVGGRRGAPQLDARIAVP